MTSNVMEIVRNFAIGDHLGSAVAVSSQLGWSVYSIGVKHVGVPILVGNRGVMF
jgi:hypothetical protein